MNYMDFIQKFWRYLLTTVTFFASYQDERVYHIIVVVSMKIA